MQLSTLRIICEIKIGEFSERVAEYLDEEYQEKVEFYRGMAKVPTGHLFSEMIKGYHGLSKEAQKNFDLTIMPFLQCQGKGRLTNSTIDHIEDRNEPEGIRVYLMEYGEMGYQYFKNGSWN